MCTFIKGFKWVSIVALTLSCLFAVEANTDTYNNQGQQKAPHPDQEKNNFYNL